MIEYHITSIIQFHNLVIKLIHVNYDIDIAKNKIWLQIS